MHEQKAPLISYPSPTKSESGVDETALVFWGPKSTEESPIRKSLLGVGNIATVRDTLCVDGNIDGVVNVSARYAGSNIANIKPLLSASPPPMVAGNDVFTAAFAGLPSSDMAKADDSMQRVRGEDVFRQAFSPLEQASSVLSIGAIDLAGHAAHAADDHDTLEMHTAVTEPWQAPSSTPRSISPTATTQLGPRPGMEISLIQSSSTHDSAIEVFRGGATASSPKPSHPIPPTHAPYDRHYDAMSLPPSASATPFSESSGTRTPNLMSFRSLCTPDQVLFTNFHTEPPSALDLLTATPGASRVAAHFPLDTPSQSGRSGMLSIGPLIYIQDTQPPRPSPPLPGSPEVRVSAVSIHSPHQAVSQRPAPPALGAGVAPDCMPATEEPTAPHTSGSRPERATRKGTERALIDGKPLAAEGRTKSKGKSEGEGERKRVRTKVVNVDAPVPSITPENITAVSQRQDKILAGTHALDLPSEAPLVSPSPPSSATPFPLFPELSTPQLMTSPPRPTQKLASPERPGPRRVLVNSMFNLNRAEMGPRAMGVASSPIRGTPQRLAVARGTTATPRAKTGPQRILVTAAAKPGVVASKGPPTRGIFASSPLKATVAPTISQRSPLRSTHAQPRTNAFTVSLTSSTFGHSASARRDTSLAMLKTASVSPTKNGLLLSSPAAPRTTGPFVMSANVHAGPHAATLLTSVPEVASMPIASMLPRPVFGGVNAKAKIKTKQEAQLKFTRMAAGAHAPVFSGSVNSRTQIFGGATIPEEGACVPQAQSTAQHDGLPEAEPKSTHTSRAPRSVQIAMQGSSKNVPPTEPSDAVDRPATPPNTHTAGTYSPPRTRSSPRGVLSSPAGPSSPTPAAATEEEPPRRRTPRRPASTSASQPPAAAVVKRKRKKPSQDSSSATPGQPGAERSIMDLSSAAIQKLTVQNTARNQAYHNELDWKVEFRNYPRPPSPSSKIPKTAVETAREDRAKRRGRAKKGAGSNGGGGEDEDSEEDELLLQSPQRPLKHPRAPGDEEDYSTPKKARVVVGSDDESVAVASGGNAKGKRASSRKEGGKSKGKRKGSKDVDANPDADAEGGKEEDKQSSEGSDSSKTKGVRWDKLLAVEPREGSGSAPNSSSNSDKATGSSRKSCLAPKVYQLDHMGNIPQAEEPLAGILEKQVVPVSRVVYEDDPGAAKLRRSMRKSQP
ncbi:hypothetical protein BOTBODRAFT_175181 [Botryobasidium botryosum FD-172 SS1]|uniref:Uncharacterized protein n=1 Tax=Botryobasidium botryosum (strain FD-172 SS1) TaxID=930990 RepID=A0A067MH78_BOTB1|nr:hypothetical protein BOTBODRAFT_175181 [Botryobasidium botryosum FD-172 SS1]